MAVIGLDREQLQEEVSADCGAACVKRCLRLGFTSSHQPVCRCIKCLQHRDLYLGV